MVSSTVPRPAAKCPPRVLTVWIRNSRSSCARAGSFPAGRRRRSAGVSIAASSGYLSSAALIVAQFTRAPPVGPKSTPAGVTVRCWRCGAPRLARRCAHSSSVSAAAGSSLVGSKGCSSGWLLRLRRISTFCCAVCRQAWQCRVSTTPRSNVRSASSRGRSPCSSRSTSASSSASACSKSCGWSDTWSLKGSDERADRAPCCARERYTAPQPVVNARVAPVAPGGIEFRPCIRPSLSEGVMNLKGSKTEKNLKDAFAGESQANRRYLYFAAKADVEGLNDVSAVFRSTAEGETGHAHGHLEYLEAVGDPATGLPIGETRLNLKAAIAGETHEYSDMYPGMAKSAREEGFAEIADWFETLAKAERSHANRLQKALDSM